MKVIPKKDRITVYIITKENINDINEYIKKVILTLKRKYKIDIFGFYKINVYKNNKIGVLIDIIKEDDIDYFKDLLDLKIKVYENSKMYLKFNDYFLNEKKNIIIKNNNYYIDIDNLREKELIKMIEFCEILVGEKQIEK